MLLRRNWIALRSICRCAYASGDALRPTASCNSASRQTFLVQWYTDRRTTSTCASQDSNPFLNPTLPQLSSHPLTLPLLLFTKPSSSLAKPKPTPNLPNLTYQKTFLQTFSPLFKPHILPQNPLRLYTRPHTHQTRSSRATSRDRYTFSCTRRRKAGSARRQYNTLVRCP
jgi:hypothetical protein